MDALPFEVHYNYLAPIVSAFDLFVLAAVSKQLHEYYSQAAKKLVKRVERRDYERRYDVYHDKVKLIHNGSLERVTHVKWDSEYDCPLSTHYYKNDIEYKNIFHTYCKIILRENTFKDLLKYIDINTYYAISATCKGLHSIYHYQKIYLRDSSNGVETHGIILRLCSVYKYLYLTHYASGTSMKQFYKGDKLIREITI